jgi:prepilin-type N-terminal cleavage/methylation domain-containing protein
MRADTTFANAPRRRVPVVGWQDCAWEPRIEFRRPRLRLDFHPPRRNYIYPKIMKPNLSASRRHRAGFTLVELLTVIAIIAILAAMLLTVVSHAITSAKKTKARLEANDIATAIQAYDSAYGRFPASAEAQKDAGTGDFTYGAVIPKPGNVVNLLNPTYSMSNCEVIAILMDFTNYPNGAGFTINTNYQKNPQQTKFLNASFSGDNSSPGVGTDLVYRDPWGNPYVITMDLNYDDMCSDAFYSLAKVSSSNGSDGGSGLNGLVEPPNTVNDYQYHGKVMVWSAGSDGLIDNGASATAGANKDNVLSWK